MKYTDQLKTLRCAAHWHERFELAERAEISGRCKFRKLGFEIPVDDAIADHLRLVFETADYQYNVAISYNVSEPMTNPE